MAPTTEGEVVDAARALALKEGSEVAVTFCYDGTVMMVWKGRLGGETAEGFSSAHGALGILRLRLEGG